MRHMRWLWAIAFLLALAALPALGRTMYARFSAPVRSDRSLSAGTLGTLRQGEAVEAVGRQGGYFQVSYRGATGWVYYNKLANEKPEDVAALLGGGTAGAGIELAELEAGGALRGLSPMAENYVKASDVPSWAADAVESMQARAVSSGDLDQFQKEGKLGEYGGRGSE